MCQSNYSLFLYDFMTTWVPLIDCAYCLSERGLFTMLPHPQRLRCCFPVKFHSHLDCWFLNNDGETYLLIKGQIARFSKFLRLQHLHLRCLGFKVYIHLLQYYRHQRPILSQSAINHSQTRLDCLALGSGEILLLLCIHWPGKPLLKTKENNAKWLQQRL